MYRNCTVSGTCPLACDGAQLACTRCDAGAMFAASEQRLHPLCRHHTKHELRTIHTARPIGGPAPVTSQLQPSSGQRVCPQPTPLSPQYYGLSLSASFARASSSPPFFTSVLLSPAFQLPASFSLPLPGMAARTRSIMSPQLVARLVFMPCRVWVRSMSRCLCVRALSPMAIC